MSKSLLEILYESDVKVIQRGERWVARCPFHAGDNSPSFTIYPNMTYYCFGCRVWGDAVKFLVDYRGLPYAMAVEIAGIPVNTRPIRRVIKSSSAIQSRSYLAKVALQYHDFLMQTPGAINYLHYRGLSDETISKFKLGFSDGGVVTPDSDKEFSAAISTGILSKDDKENWWETLAQRITIPNMSSLGGTPACDYIMGRTVAKDKLKYLGLKIARPLYGLADIVDSPIVFLVEGHFDWLVLKQWGFPAVVSGGVSLPAYNLIPLRSRRLVIVPDNDEPGMMSATAIASKVEGSTILDYADMGVKDVGDIATISGGMEAFIKRVEEQTTWHPSM